MTRLFFQKHVPGDPVLAPLFANAPSGLPEQMAAWLGEVFGGPPPHGDADRGDPPILAPHLSEGLNSEQPSPWGAPLTPAAPRSCPPPPPPLPGPFPPSIRLVSP